MLDFSTLGDNTLFRIGRYLMRYGLLGTIVIILIVAALLQNIYIGGLGGLVLLILLVLFLTGRL